MRGPYSRAFTIGMSIAKSVCGEAFRISEAHRQPIFYGEYYMVKAYLSILSMFLLAAAVLLVTDSFTWLLAVAFGFTALALTFAGMICVLPTVAHNQHEAAIHDSAPRPRFVVEPAKPPMSPVVGVLKSA